jgi:hypothetical protein
MKFLRKTVVVATLTWLPIAVSCAILLYAGDPLRCVAVGAWRALPAWPTLFAVLLPMMGIAEILDEARPPAAVRVPARSTRTRP